MTASTPGALILFMGLEPFIINNCGKPVPIPRLTQRFLSSTLLLLNQSDFQQSHRSQRKDWQSRVLRGWESSVCKFPEHLFAGQGTCNSWLTKMGTEVVGGCRYCSEPVTSTLAPYRLALQTCMPSRTQAAFLCTSLSHFLVSPA